MQNNPISACVTQGSQDTYRCYRLAKLNLDLQMILAEMVNFNQGLMS